MKLTSFSSTALAAGSHSGRRFIAFVLPVLALATGAAVTPTAPCFALAHAAHIYKVATEKRHITLRLVIYQGSLRKNQAESSAVSLINHSHHTIRYTESGCARPTIYDRVVRANRNVVWQPSIGAGKGHVCPDFIAIVTVQPGKAVYVTAPYQSPRRGKVFVQALVHLTAPHVRIATPKIPIHVR